MKKIIISCLFIALMLVAPSLIFGATLDYSGAEKLGAGTFEVNGETATYTVIDADPLNPYKESLKWSVTVENGKEYELKLNVSSENLPVEIRLKSSVDQTEVYAKESNVTWNGNLTFIWTVKVLAGVDNKAVLGLYFAKQAGEYTFNSPPEFSEVSVSTTTTTTTTTTTSTTTTTTIPTTTTTTTVPETTTTTTVPDTTTTTVATTTTTTPTTTTSTTTTTTLPKVPPDKVANLAAAPGSGMVTLSWDKSLTTVYYTLQYGDSAAVDLGDVDQYTVIGLINGMAYTFQVQAWNEYGCSEAATVPATPQASDLAAPIYLAVDVDQGGGATISWEYPEESPAEGARIYVDGDLAETTDGQSVTSYLLAGILIGQEVKLEVTLYITEPDDSVTESPKSSANFTIPDTYKPKKVVAQVCDGLLTLKIDGVKPESGAGYEVMINDVKSNIDSIQYKAYTLEKLATTLPFNISVKVKYLSGEGETVDAVTGRLLGSLALYCMNGICWPFVQTSSDIVEVTAKVNEGEAFSFENGKPFSVNSGDAVTIYSKDTATGISGINFQTTVGDGTNPEFYLFFEEGWSIGSIPISDVDIFQVLKQEKDKIISAWKWENNTWVVYLFGETDEGAAYAISKGFNLLTSINFSDGFWINVAEAFSATVTGQPSWNKPVVFLKGWNLKGANSIFTVDASDLQPEGEDLQTVSAWKWVGDKWAVYLPEEPDGGASYAASKGFIILEEIYPGEGFWINVSKK
ncbi:MAG: fibronectin type III domain-containing protein [Patescibacteria group bacterium]